MYDDILHPFLMMTKGEKNELMVSVCTHQGMYLNIASH